MSRNRGRLTLCRVMFAILTCVAGLATTEILAGQTKNCDSSTVDDWGQDNAAKARAFLAALKSGVRADDRTKIAAMVFFPLNVFGAGSKRVIHNPHEFIRGYPSILTAHVRQTILKQWSDCLFGNWKGAMVGDGAIWFAEQSTGEFKIVAVNLGQRQK